MFNYLDLASLQTFNKTLDHLCDVISKIVPSFYSICKSSFSSSLISSSSFSNFLTNKPKSFNIASVIDQASVLF